MRAHAGGEGRQACASNSWASANFCISARAEVKIFYPLIKQRNIPVKLSLYTGIKAGFLAQLTKLSAAILARRATADSTSSTARSRNDARRVL